MQIQWQIKDSLLAYMQRDDSFTVTASGGAGFAPESGVTLPAESTPDGAVRATGTIVLSAHDGALTVPLVNVVIDDDALWIADPAHEGTGEAPRIRLVTLHRDEAADPAAAGRSIPTKLAGDADGLFLYMYVPATDFAPLRIVS